ncbi:12507_t:CDS:2, partial [Racocetra fulgida]
CKASILPKEIVLQHLQNRDGDWRNQRFYNTVIRELNEGGCLKYQINLEKIKNTVVDILVGNLQYEWYKQQDTLVSERLPSSTIPIELSDNSECKQSITIDQCEIHPTYNQECSVNIELIVDINFGEYIKWLDLWMLMSVFPVSDCRFYWRTIQEHIKPMNAFNFQSVYGSYYSKVATVNNVYLIAASLKDRKPQCVIATASTTTIADEVEHIVKER